MRFVGHRTSPIGSNRAATLVGLLVVVVGALIACGSSDDGAPDGGAGAQDAAGGGNVADGTNANGQEGGAGVDSSTSGSDARAGDGASGDGASSADSGGGDGAQTADGAADGGVQDAAVDTGSDANGETLVIRVDPRNDCTVTTTPPSPIKIAAGQWFYATFINVGEISTDIAKRDQFNVVPLVLGLEPTMTYADTIRPWCQGVSGKFWFEITPCQNSPYELEVDCGP